jgi:hypothetical protein
VAGFTKLFGSIIASTIWDADDHTRIVWITMLALADQYGRVEASVPGLAHQARVSVEETRDALEILESPDPDSRTPDHEGRRIAKMEGGWRLLNYGKYREKQDEEAQRERNAARQARHREKVRNAKRNALSRAITQSNPIAEAEAESTTGPSVTASPEEPISPEMVAASVKDELSISGQRVTLCLIEIARSKLKAGENPTVLRNSLVKAWLDYKPAAPHLEWTWGSPESFYQSDKWHDPELWPWKNGHQPERNGHRKYYQPEMEKS